MNAARTCELPPAAYAELENFLRNSGSTLALALVEHANHQSQNTLERRLPRYRRQYDLLSDDH